MDKKLEFYKEQYYFELNRKQNITANLPVTIGFITVLYTGITYFAINFICIIGHFTLWIFIATAAFALFFTSKASYYLFKAFKGLEYIYIPSAKKINDYEVENRNNPEIDEIFFEGIKRSYINSATQNKKSNNIRSNYLYKTNIYVLKAIILLLLSAIPFFIGKNHNEYKELNNYQNFTVMTTSDDNNSDKPQETTSETTPERTESREDTISRFPADEGIYENLELSENSEK